MDYWSQFVDKLVVYDNMSTDNSRELLSKYNFVEIRDYNTGGIYEDLDLIRMKNNVWKESINSEYDWCIVCDFDECLYCKEALKDVLAELDKKNISMISPTWCDLYFKSVPSYEETLLHKRCHNFMPQIDNDNCCKFLIFNLHKVLETNYGVGGHHCDALKKGISLVTYQITLYHIKNLGIDYIVDRFQKLNARRSSLDKQIGYGSHWADQADREKFTQIFNDSFSKTLPTF